MEVPIHLYIFSALQIKELEECIKDKKTRIEILEKKAINAILCQHIPNQEFEEAMWRYETKHGKEARIILEDKLRLVAKNVLAYYFGE